MIGLLGMIRGDICAAIKNDDGAPPADSAEGNAVKADRFMNLGKPRERCDRLRSRWGGSLS